MITTLFLLLLAPTWTDTDREDAIWSFSQCAAFHAIEADLTKDGTTAVEAHRAASRDFADAAKRLAPADGVDKVQQQRAEIEKSYRDALSEGDSQTMAEGWTELELACKDLYGVRDKAGQITAGEPAGR
jgi:hypothetical protein